MTRTIRTAVSAVVLAVGLGAPAAALPPLHEDLTVYNGFYAIGLADEVRKNCPSIEPRLMRAWSYLESLKKYARDKGYSSSDIKALQNNKAEKEKLKARIRADLASRGARPGDADGHCAVGQEEIARDSAAGRLLKGK